MKFFSTSLLFILFSSSVYAETSYKAKRISTVSEQTKIGCTLFKLEGVKEADPAKPNSSWFALHFSKSGYTDTVKKLFSAYSHGKSIHVSTTGKLVCGGFASVADLQL
jgi:hypothetical protein